MNAYGIFPTTRCPRQIPFDIFASGKPTLPQVYRQFFFLTNVHPPVFTGAAFDPFRKLESLTRPGRSRVRSATEWRFESLYVCVYMYTYVYNRTRTPVVGCNINTPRKLDSRV